MDNLDFAKTSEWLDTLERINKVRKQAPWDMADALLVGIEGIGQGNRDTIAELYDVASEQLEISRKTLMNYVSCARTFPESRRRERLEIGHHIAVLGMDEELQDSILSDAEENAWSVAQIRKEVAAPSNQQPWYRPFDIESLFYRDAIPLAIEEPTKATMKVGGRTVIIESNSEIKWRIE